MRYFGVLMRLCDQQKGASKQKQVFLLLLMIASSASATVADSKTSQESEFAHALALSAGSQSEQAYPLLESLFAKKETVEAKRQQAALILAFAPNSQLKLRKRHEYASYCLMFESKDGVGLETSTRLSLLRIAADGYFDEKRSDLASDRYLELRKEGELKHQAYAEYRLGWIELNQEQPVQAVKRWSQLIREKQEALSVQDPDLTRSIVRDLGKAWVESRTIPASALPGVGSFQGELVAGIALGLRRVSDEAQLIALKQKLDETPIAPLLRAELLNKGSIFESHPCLILEWSEVASSSKGSPGQQLPILISCARKVLEHQQCELPRVQALTKALASYELQGEARHPRISYELGCSHWMDACSDLLALEKEELQKSGKRLASEKEDTLRESCIAADSQKVPQISHSIDSLMESLALSKLLPAQVSGDPLSALLIQEWKDGARRSAWLERIKTTPARYQATWIPEVLVQSLSDQEVAQAAPNVLRDFAQKPVGGPYVRVLEQQVRTLVDQKQFGEARKLLAAYAPLNSTEALREELSNLWQYYWLGLPDPISDEERQTLAIWKGSSDPARTLALYLRSSQLDRIWRESKKLLSVAHQKPELLGLLYEQTLDQLGSKTAPTSDFKQSLQATTEGRALLRLNLAISASSLPSSQEIQRISRDLRISPHAEAPAFAVDLQHLNRLADLSHKLRTIKFRLNGLLPSTLARSLKNYQSERTFFEKTQWSLVSSQNVAETQVRADSQWILDQVTLLERKASSQPAFAALSTQLSELSRQLQVQLAASQTSKGGSG